MPGSIISDIIDVFCFTGHNIGTAPIAEIVPTKEKPDAVCVEYPTQTFWLTYWERVKSVLQRRGVLLEDEAGIPPLEPTGLII
mmetsp:Transcript_26140/g.63001  ORF Transcript_26140/g.63001 Transcript_26140/m.63001 type:complete len:83 (-) Transcript_26140:470-718(-)